LIELAKQFEKAHPNTEIAARINEKVQVITANSIGGKVAEIKMPDASGKIVSLTSIKAKYILIDFWASWCAPCRRESVLLGELYTKYKAEGLEIFGVGLEASKETWIKAIEKDKRTWINVSTFQQFESPVAFQYAVTALPANVLIDHSGKVIARDLHGAELKKMIKKLFLSK
jgi:thiol-disulfide isomerase/thioredoxin